MNQLYALSRPQPHKPHTARAWCLLLGLLTLSFSASAQITGRVFRDFNADGVQSTSATSTTFTEPGVPGVSIKAFNASGVQSASATSGADGTYTLATTGAGPFRVEFSNLTAGDFDAFRGSSSGTSVQFAAGGATVNYGVYYPAQFCERNPQLVTTCFVAINAANSPPLGNRDAMVGVPYNATDKAAPVAEYAIVNEIGAAWGLAYKKNTKQMFSAAFTKRHVGFAAGGPNAIYITNVTSGTGNTTQFFNFTSVGGGAVSTAAETHGNDIPTALNSNGRLDSYDIPAFDAVGKTSLGDIDISDDDKTLYVVNLKDRKLYSIDIATKAAVGVAIPSPCGTQSYRPFAVKYYRGKVYVGVVCTREDLDLDANNDGRPDTYAPTPGLSATVYEFDGSTFTSVLSFPLTYKKQPTNADKTGQERAEYWRPWASTYQTDRGDTSYPEAWLTDIEFDVDGDMIVGLRDRFGDQVGYQNRRPIAGDGAFISGISPGEVLRASKCTPTATTWTLESGGSLCGATASALQAAQQGPGDGKYYWGDRVQNGGNHGLSSMGGLALLAGSDKLAMTAIDPADDFNTGGFKRLLNSTGAKDGNATGTAYNPGAGFVFYGGDALGYGKANGLGDLEALCSPSPVQIGNRVWKDNNNNGVQDPGEAPLAGITVTLKGPGLAAAGETVTTNANGEYYFSNATGTDAAGFNYGLTGLTLGGSYSLTFPTSASAGALNLSAKPNSATGTNADAIDSDANGSGVVSFTLGQAGENDFTYDAAFIDTPPCALTATVVSGTCNPATNLYAISGTISLTSATAGTATVTDGARSTTVTIAAAATSVAYSLTGLTSGTGSRTVTVALPGCGTATATYNAPVSCTIAPCSLSASVTNTNCVPATNQYTSTVSVTLVNPLAGTIIFTDGPRSGTVSVTASTSSASFTFNNLTSDGLARTVTVSLPGCGSTTANYTAPGSCSVAPICSVSAIATASVCNTATNTYSSTVVVTITNPSGNTLTVTNRGVTQALSTTAGTSSNTLSFVFNGLISDGGSYTTTATLPGCGSATAGYTAPVSCSTAPCALSITTASLPAGQVGTAYSQTLTVSGATAPTTFSISAGNLPAGLTLNASTGVISGTPTSATTGSFTVVATDAKGCVDPQPLSITTSALPVCALTATVTPGVCNSATNQYSVTGSVSATNATGSQSLTVAVGSVSQVVSLSGNGPVSYTLAGLTSDGVVKTVTVMSSASACSMTSTTFAAPASCSVAPCSLSLTTSNLLAGQVGTAYSQTLTTSGATGVTSFSLASGSLPAGLSLSAAGVISGTPSATGTASFSVRVTDASGCTATAPLTITVNLQPTSFCSLTVTPVAGACTTVTNGTTVSGVFSSTISVRFVSNTPAGSLVISDGSSSTTVAVSANQPGVAVVFTSLPADGNTRTVGYGFTSGATDCGAFALTYVAPVSCAPTPPANPMLTLTKLVSKSKAIVGEIISYSVVLTNTASATVPAATNITVQDNLTGGAYVTASASAPAGTTFTPGTPTGTWQVASLAGGQSLTLTLQAQATEGGVVYNTATIPGTATATVCTSVPVQVCAGDVFEYEITAAPGRSSYRWYRSFNGTETELTGSTTNVLSVTALGEYRLAVDNVTGLCPDFSCCPFIVEEAAPVASFSLVSTTLSCSGGVAQLDGSVRVTGLTSTSASGPLTYELAQGGTDFESGTKLTTGKTALPAGGVLATNLAAGTYRVRVYNAAGCFRDAEIVIVPVNCEVVCPPAKCAPFVIQQTKKAPRVVSN